MLANVESLDIVSSLLKQIHGSTSREWNLQDGLTGKRKVWYRFTDRMMRSDAHLNKTLNYIHYNPVKHGMVKDMHDWQWSSLQWYLIEKGQEWLLEFSRRYQPPEDFGKEWDI